MLSPEEKGEFVDSINALTTIAYSFLQQQQGQAETYGQAEGHGQSTSKEGEGRLSRRKENKKKKLTKKRNLRQRPISDKFTSSTVTKRLDNLEKFLFGSVGGNYDTGVKGVARVDEWCPKTTENPEAEQVCSVADLFKALQEKTVGLADEL
eukprot:GSA25T00024033001.1